MTKTPIPKGLRRRVFERDGYTCRYCGANGEGIVLHADHVYPESKGGETTLNNLATACAGCNHKKYTSVGMWPKPIGYFSIPEEDDSEFMVDSIYDKNSTDRTYIVMFLGVVIAGVSLCFILLPDMSVVSTIGMLLGLALLMMGFGMVRHQEYIRKHIDEEYYDR